MNVGGSKLPFSEAPSFFNFPVCHDGSYCACAGVSAEGFHFSAFHFYWC